MQMRTTEQQLAIWLWMWILRMENQEVVEIEHQMEPLEQDSEKKREKKKCDHFINVDMKKRLNEFVAREKKQS